MKKGLILVALFLGISAPALASEEIRVNATVLSSEPVYRDYNETFVPRHCQDGKPAEGGFLALINWDIACSETRTFRELTGYKVRYELDGHVFTDTFAEPPGETIPLLVQWR